MIIAVSGFMSTLSSRSTLFQLTPADMKPFAEFMLSTAGLLQLLGSCFRAESARSASEALPTLKLIERCAAALFGAATNVGLEDVQRSAELLQQEASRFRTTPSESDSVISCIDDAVAKVRMHLEEYEARVATPQP